jgi:wyosine [tRNA(Phe)-imidazoG37] synthetase (radical SAM superfamily)
VRLVSDYAPGLNEPVGLPERETAFGLPRHRLGNRFVYAVISSRAGGLSLGVNFNPDGRCNFSCPYCEVSRADLKAADKLDVRVMSEELERTLRAFRNGFFCKHPFFQTLPPHLLQLRHVALSGDGEPTLAPNFSDAVQALAGVRARGTYFKMVLLTNGTVLNNPEVAHGLEQLALSDEIWIKLDGGSQAYLNLVNHPLVPVETILKNILLIGRKRPVVIQSLFPSILGEEPSPEEIREYTARLCELVNAGAQISLVQIYSATRPRLHPEFGHLPLRYLSQIAQSVRRATKLRVEVF